MFLLYLKEGFQGAFYSDLNRYALGGGINRDSGGINYFTDSIGLILPARRAVTAEIATRFAIRASAEAAIATIAIASEAAILAWFRFIHIQISTVDFLAIELGDGCFAGFFRSHFHEAKAS